MSSSSKSRRTWSAPTVRLQKDIDLSDAVAWARSVWPVTVHADCVLDDEVYDRLAWWSGADQSGLRALNELLHPQGTSES